MWKKWENTAGRSPTNAAEISLTQTSLAGRSVAEIPLAGLKRCEIPILSSTNQVYLNKSTVFQTKASCLNFLNYHRHLNHQLSILSIL
jgi:hypothetical protein